MIQKTVASWSLLLAICCSSAIAQTGFWQQTSFPSNCPGEFDGLFAKKNLVLAGDSYNTGLVGSALALSTDSGKHWAKKGTFQFLLPGSLQIMDSGIMLVVNATDLQMYRSTDYGESWSPTGSFMANQIISGQGVVYASAYDGVYRSTNSGQSWIPENHGLPPPGGGYLLGISPGGTLLAATQSAGLFLSNNFAVSWNALNRIPGYNEASAVALNSTGQIFVAVISTGYVYNDSLYRSDDNGATWKGLIPCITNFLFVDPTNDAIVFATPGGSGYSLSMDKGKTWKVYPTPAEPRSLCYDGSSTFFMGTYGLGVMKSNSLTGQWQPCNTGMPGSLTSVSAIVCPHSGTVFAGTRTFGIFKSTDGGYNFDGSPVTIPYYYPLLQLASTSNGNLFSVNYNFYHSTDDGVTWPQYNVTPGLLYDLTARALSTSGATVLVSGTGTGGLKLDRSTDQGETWTEPYAVNFYYQANALVSVLPMNTRGVVLASTGYNTNSAQPSRIYGLIRSTDFGATWNDVAVNLSSVPAFSCLGWDSKGNAYAVTTLGILRTSDNGSTWNPVSGSIPTLDIRCLVINASDDIYIGTGNSGVLLSTDGGTSWSQQNSGMTDSVVNTLAIGPDGYLFAGTEHGGVYRSASPTSVLNTPGGLFRVTFALDQNYPNPFNPSTTIRYSTPQRSQVTLTVFNTLGQEITTLVNENQDAGVHDVRFDGIGLASGVYFYRLQVGDYVSTKRLVLVR